MNRAILATLAALLPVMAEAEDITLKSTDGTVNIVGEFVEFSDNAYVVRTALGNLRVSAATVTCEGAACPTIETTAVDVSFAGSDTIGFGIMPLLLSGFAANKGAADTVSETGVEGQVVDALVADDGFGEELGKILVTSTSSGDAFKALLASTAEFGMASRRILLEEAKALKAAGAGNMVSPTQEHIIAVDSLVVIVHPENPVKSLTTDQLRNIFGGIIVNWNEVGGPDLPIQVIDRQEGSGTRAVFQRAVFGENAVPPIPGAMIIDDNNQVAATVNEGLGAISYVGYAFVRGAKAVPLVNECGIQMLPDAFSAKTEEYPLQRRLYIYNREGALSPLGKALLDFSLSSAADEVIARTGFIDLGVVRQPRTLESPRGQALLAPNDDAYESGVMREMLAGMIEHDRLSTTFRFSPGSATLDERGQLDLDRLASYLEGMPAGTKVIFVGFTDDVGEFTSNRSLSESRAKQIMEELSAVGADRLANVELSSTGFGETAPSACNTSKPGQAINRRVEVWIQSPV